MVIIRIALKKYSKELYAPGVQGRWNSEGKKVIYTASTLSLAALESMFRRKGCGYNNDYATMLINAPDDIGITEIDTSSLPKGWNHPFDYSVCQSLGDEWYEKEETPLLKVPSAIIPMDYNYVINTRHKDYKQIKLIGVTDFIPDPRIEELLKNQNK